MPKPANLPIWNDLDPPKDYTFKPFPLPRNWREQCDAAQRIAQQRFGLDFERLDEDEQKVIWAEVMKAEHA